MNLLTAIISYFRNDDEEGQGLAEYALILALIAIMGGQVSKILSNVGNSV
jgi:Flp pilus assembly pilin Flp